MIRKSITTFNKTSPTSASASLREHSPRSYFKSYQSYMKRKKYVEKLEDFKLDTKKETTSRPLASNFSKTINV